MQQDNTTKFLSNKKISSKAKFVLLLLCIKLYSLVLKFMQKTIKKQTPFNWEFIPKTANAVIRCLLYILYTIFHSKSTLFIKLLQSKQKRWGKPHLFDCQQLVSYFINFQMLFKPYKEVSSKFQYYHFLTLTLQELLLQGFGLVFRPKAFQRV